MIAYTMITGASSGIGLEMAKMLAKKNYNLILIARSEQRLNQIQKELTEKHNVVIQIMLIDLAEKNAAQDIYNQVKENNWQVAGLINNAGFGDYGHFVEMPLNNDEEMIAV
ncbi:MAG: SDR family NAD(P)-dependent oxidoreductase, partial [Flavobacteriales bacterium]